MRRVLVVGCGGIGGNVAAGLAQHGPELVSEVVGLSTNAEIARAVSAEGFRIVERGGTRTIAGRVVTEPPAGAEYDWILLCTQPPQVEEAARSVVRHLARDGAMVVLQNGLCEPRIAEIAGADRTIGAVVAWGASMTAPGVYERTSDGGFHVGRLDGTVDDKLRELALLLEIVGPVDVTPNLAGARWSKLAINCAISTLGTIAGDRLGVVMRQQFARRVGLEIVSEAVAVAKAEGVRLEKISGTLDLEWLALTDAERRSTGSLSLVAKHGLMMAVGTRYRNLRSSMLNAIERGRPPSVSFLNGEIVARGARHGIPTPFNAAASELVRAISRGEAKSSLDTLRTLWPR
jgi:2-dehydropantoate 2-reductase